MRGRHRLAPCRLRCRWLGRSCRGGCGWLLPVAPCCAGSIGFCLPAFSLRIRAGLHRGKLRLLRAASTLPGISRRLRRSAGFSAWHSSRLGPGVTLRKGLYGQDGGSRSCLVRAGGQFLFSLRRACIIRS